MSDRHDQTVLNYARLAAVSWQRGQLPGRDRLLILCGAAACHAGLLAVAERCRELVLVRNPRHLLHRYPSFPDALRGAELPPLVRQLTRQCSPEQAEFLLSRLDSPEHVSGQLAPADNEPALTDTPVIAPPAAGQPGPGPESESESSILRWLAEPSVSPDLPAADPGD